MGEEEGEGQRRGGSQKEAEAVGGDEGAAPRAPPSLERVSLDKMKQMNRGLNTYRCRFFS